MTITILNELRRTAVIKASILDENFDYTRDRSQVVVDNGQRCAYASVRKWRETDGCDFEVEVGLSPKQFAELKSLIKSL